MSGLAALAFRPAEPGDAAQIAALTVEGMATYREFAPAGWAPPNVAGGRAQIAESLARPDVWALLAEHGDVVVGHVATIPAEGSRVPTTEQGLLHLWQLFVTRAWWGSGLAVELHRAAVADATARGFRAIRLFTPAGQLRARRFYEREGWELAGEPFFEPALGLELTEYRLWL